MAAANADFASRRRVRWPQLVLKSPIEFTCLVLESLVARRGLVMLFVGVAMLLTVSGWLRPPLSPDLRAHHIPLSVLTGPVPEAEQILLVPRSARLDSIGAVLIGSLVVGGTIALVWPRRLFLFAAIMLWLSIVANVVLWLNYPSLIERLESEHEQREQIARVLITLHPDSLANGGEPRIIPSLDLAPLLRGYDYLLYGPWLAAWSAVGVLLTARGSVGHRLGWIGLCAVCGVGVAAALCLPRLRGEFLWTKATELDAQGRFADAHGLLDRAVSTCPELDRTWRVHQLRGKLEFRLNQPSLDQELWRIDQWLRNGEGAKAAAMTERLVATKPNDRFVTRLAAETLTHVGLEYWVQGRSAAAGQMWQQALRLDEHRWDSRFLLGTVQSRMDRNRPELVDVELSPILGRLADRLLRADILANLGDAYFDAGEMDIARRHYEESLRVFELPKEINYRARKGLVGM
jgi:Tetratricopeptide repeat